MSVPETAKTPVPGVVIAAVALLAAGGALSLLTVLVRGVWAVNTGLSAGFGALYLLLAYHLYRRRRWARTAILVLCVVGAALGVLQVFHSGRPAVAAIGGPILYAVLLNLPSAQAWFAKPGPVEPPSGDDPPADEPPVPPGT